MAVKALTKGFISINAVDLSDHIKSMTLNYGAESLDVSAMGDTTRKRLGGLKDWSIEVEFFQDYAAGKVDATLFGIVGSSIAIEVRSDQAAVSATNPKWTGNAILESYPPVTGAHGAEHMVSITLQGNGDLTRATS